MINFQNIWKTNYHHSYVVSGRNIVLIVRNIDCLTVCVWSSALNLLYSYLSNRKQRVKVNNCFSDWVDVIVGIPQGAVVGPLFSISLLMLYSLQWVTMIFLQLC